MATDLEIWESQIKGREGVVRVQPGGGTTIELIKGGTTFTCLPEERRMTDQAARNPKRKPFSNGIFRPVELIDSDQDFERLKAQSEGSMTDDEVEAVFEGHFKTVEAKIRKIDSPYTLRRILEHGEATGAATKRLQMVRDRLNEIEPREEPQAEPDLNNEVDEGPGGARPRVRQSYYPDADVQSARVRHAGG